MNGTPEKLGRYEIQEELDRGGMGVVYRAVHEYTRREVALKHLYPNFTDTEVGAERFRREVRVSALVDAPGVVEVYDAGEYEGTFYYAMELLEGREFSEIMLQCPIDRALEYLAFAAETLGKCHAAGVVHRDLKPENIFILEDGGDVPVKLLDFGIAALLQEGPRPTQSGFALGTPRYMSPEQARNAKKAGPRSDVWSLGVILYLLLSGRLPFDGNSSTNVALQIIQEEPDPIAPPDGVDPALVDIVDRCLRKEPHQRFSDAGELGRAMRRAGVDSHHGGAAATRGADGDAAGRGVSGDVAPREQPAEAVDEPDRGVAERGGAVPLFWGAVASIAALFVGALVVERFVVGSDGQADRVRAKESEVPPTGSSAGTKEPSASTASAVSAAAGSTASELVGRAFVDARRRATLGYASDALRAAAEAGKSSAEAERSERTAEKGARRADGAESSDDGPDESGPSAGDPETSTGASGRRAEGSGAGAPPPAEGSGSTADATSGEETTDRSGADEKERRAVGPEGDDESVESPAPKTSETVESETATEEAQPSSEASEGPASNDDRSTDEESETPFSF